jgi:hypothetical protein
VIWGHLLKKSPFYWWMSDRLMSLHATQVFQDLELTLFGVLKRRPRYELPCWDDNARIKFAWMYITISGKRWYSPIYGEPVGHSDLQVNLNLTREPSHIGFYSTSKTWEKVRAFGDSPTLTFLWTSCRADDVLVGLIGSTSPSKTT